jgi:hypothetical protein
VWRGVCFLCAANRAFLERLVVSSALTRHASVEMPPSESVVSDLVTLGLCGISEDAAMGGYIWTLEEPLALQVRLCSPFPPALLFSDSFAGCCCVHAHVSL